MILFSRSILARKTEFSIKLYGETLKIYPQVKFLGITFESQLNFKKHFEDILDCCSTRYHRLRLSPSLLIEIYKQSIRPIFEQGSLSTITASDYVISKIQQLQKKRLSDWPYVYQNTSVLSCSMTPLAFHMFRIVSSPVQRSPWKNCTKPTSSIFQQAQSCLGSFPSAIISSPSCKTSA